MLLSKWSTATKRHGGFGEERHRAACLEFLTSVIGVVCQENGGIEVPIVLDDSWNVPWPRPQVKASGVVLTCTAEGFVDLGGFCADLAQRSASRSNWWHQSRLIACWGTATGTMSIVRFVTLTINSGKAAPFAKQLVWHLGWAFQAACLKAIAGGEAQVAGLQITGNSFLEVLTQAPLLDRMLVQYTESCRAKVRELKTHHFSCSTDKASVCGLGAGLQATLIGLGGTNLVVQAVPQAGSGPLTGPPLGSIPEPQTSHKPLPNLLCPWGPGGLYCVMVSWCGMCEIQGNSGNPEGQGTSRNTIQPLGGWLCGRRREP